VRALTPALLLQIPEQVVQSLMELVSEVRQHFERLTQGRSLSTLLSHMELFEGIALSDLQSLVQAAQIRQYDRGERLFAEDPRGRPPRETVHILLEGFVKVARRTPRHAGKEESGERIIAYRQGGDYFAGGLDLLGDGWLRYPGRPFSDYFGVTRRWNNVSLCVCGDILRLPLLRGTIP
jgi:signal-transduction protein with cAMP-binding, CBS, and nucleotidyltransferase domain